jgi:hypothetical protein
MVAEEEIDRALANWSRGIVPRVMSADLRVSLILNRGTLTDFATGAAGPDIIALAGRSELELKFAMAINSTSPEFKAGSKEVQEVIWVFAPPSTERSSTADAVIAYCCRASDRSTSTGSP